MPLPSAAPRPLTTPAVVVMPTLLLGIQPVTTDLYLPALPTLQRDLGASVGRNRAEVGDPIFRATPLPA